ncbi:MAG: MaoC/PaaZ C-terminal domain-containing protein [Planctomycetota bacterium]
MDDAQPFRQGLWFEDFEVGQVIWSPGRTVTETDLVLFTGLSGDNTYLHTNEELAKRSPFRGRIAHGMLVWSIASGLGVQTGIFEGTIDALAGMSMDFTAPVFPGDTVRLRLEITSKADKPSPRNGKVIFQARVFNQKDQMVVDGEWRTLVRRDRARRKAAEEAGS